MIYPTLLYFTFTYQSGKDEWEMFYLLLYLKAQVYLPFRFHPLHWSIESKHPADLLSLQLIYTIQAFNWSRWINDNQQLADSLKWKNTFYNYNCIYLFIVQEWIWNANSWVLLLFEKSHTTLTSVKREFLGNVILSLQIVRAQIAISLQLVRTLKHEYVKLHIIQKLRHMQGKEKLD